jgi:hypothetical protein
VRLDMPPGELGLEFDLVALAEHGRIDASWVVMWTRVGWLPTHLQLVLETAL